MDAKNQLDLKKILICTRVQDFPENNGEKSVNSFKKFIIPLALPLLSVERVYFKSVFFINYTWKNVKILIFTPNAYFARFSLLKPMFGYDWSGFLYLNFGLLGLTPSSIFAIFGIFHCEF